MKETIITVASLVIALVLIAFIFISSYSKDKKQETYDEIELQTSEYRTEKKMLEKKLKELNDEYAEIKQGVGSLLLVLLDTDDYVFDTVMPLLEQNNIPATLCFSLENLESIDGDFVQSKLQTLLDKSWQTAVYWDGVSDFEKWHKQISDMLLALEINTPQILCIEEDTLDLIGEIDLTLFGYKEVLVKNYSIYDLGYDSIDTNTINGVGWFVDNVPDSLTQLCDGGQIAYFVGTDHKFFAYRDDQFASMINNIVKFINSGEIECTTFSGARKAVEDGRENFESMSETLLQEISDIKKRIEDIENTIDNINKENS